MSHYPIKYFNDNQAGLLIDSSSSKRQIKLYTFDDCYFDGWDFSYPNIIFKEKKGLFWYLPVKERFMSLGRDSNYSDQVTWPDNESREASKYYCERPAFFFGYNLKNFYHFMYDTIPYLNGFLYLKNRGKNPVLLLPSDCKDTLPNFVAEFFESIGICLEKDVIYPSKSLVIKTLYVVTSFTHNGLSLDPPHPKSRTPLTIAINKQNNMNQSLKIKEKVISSDNNKLIYISRRTWINGPSSNIGTDFTQRRRFCNEDQVAEMLAKKGFTEIFMEDLNLNEKCQILENVKLIVTPAGGGLANLLLCEPPTKVLIINSPLFWDVNNRLRYAFDHLDIIDFNFTKFETFVEPKTSGTNQLSAEGGLNSPWSCDLEKLELKVDSIVNTLN